MITFADNIIAFNLQLDFQGDLPEGISMMNPFKENSAVQSISSAFYQKYYRDTKPRHLILGINPGRFGGGVTGIPFTDPKRLAQECGLAFQGKETHEPSSVFVYEMIHAYGGPEKFYAHFYIGAVCPLGFTISDGKGKEKNYNYYDNPKLTDAVYPLIVKSIQQQLAFGILTDVCFCFGTGKNEKFLRELNNQYHFFESIIALEHPRYIMQYKSKNKHEYIEKYINAFNIVRT